MTLFEVLALAHGAGLGLFCLAAFVTSLRKFARGEMGGEVLPMTLIRPLKGEDTGLEENLRAPLEADREGRLEALFAVESESDPAHPVASRVAAAFPGRARVILTGPSGTRMGKAHNMIEALRHATREFVVFSDSDARPGREALVETSRLFLAGAEAVSGLPDASMARGAGDVLVCLCFNHYFNPLATVVSATGAGTLFSGTWMALRRDALERVGGLERFSNEAADDFALADALRRAGARVALLPRLVPLYERGGGVLEGARHVLKWARIVRWTTTLPYLFLPLATPLPLALLALSRAPEDLRPAAFWLFLAATRIVCAILQDRRIAASRYPWFGYAALPVVDVGFLAPWLASWPGNTISWRGRRYRVRRGGRLEPLAS
ncbi:MAG: glycosyltransferase [Elusimicrobia bacterium]|nr:glycosyltransferase [Elusimicrobiota bacterium]